MSDNIYYVGFHSYEESGGVTLLHEDAFTKRQFDAMVAAAYTSILNRPPEPYERRRSFDDLYSPVADEMCAQFGFRKATFVATFSAFGWADIGNPLDWQQERDEDDETLRIAYETWRSASTESGEQPHGEAGGA